VDCSSEILAAGEVERAPATPWREDPDEVGRAILPAEYELVDTLRLGTWLFEVVLDVPRAAVRPLEHRDDSGFSGDVLNIFRGPTGDVTVAWRLRFDEAEQAEQARVELEGLAGARLRRDARDVILVTGTDAVAANAAFEQVSWGPVVETEVASDAQAADVGRHTLCQEPLLW
jgi:hypothetical protein